MHFVLPFPHLSRFRSAIYRLGAPGLLQLLLLTAAAGAQSFEISVSPESRQQKNLTARFDVTAKALDGFKGTIFLKAYAPTLKTAAVTLDRQTLNYPYSDVATVTVALSGVYNGDLPIVIEGRNASLFSSDTVTFIAREHAEWSLFDTLNSELPKSRISAFEVALDNAVWIATDDKGVSRFDGTLWTHYPSSGWEGTDDSTIYIGDGYRKLTDLGRYAFGVAVDSGGGVWLLSAAGLARLYKGTWTRYTSLSIMEQTGRVPASPSFPLPAMSVMGIDRNENVWLASNHDASYGPPEYAPNPALIKFNGTTFSSIPLEVPASDSRTTLAAVAVSPEGVPWVSGWSIMHSGEVWKYENSYWTYYTEKDLVSGTSTPVDLRFDPAGDLWISGTYGLVRLHGEERTMYTSNLPYIFPGLEITTIGFDKRGYIWTGNGLFDKPQEKGGLGVSRGTNSITRKFFTTKNSGLPENEVLGVKVGGDLFAWIVTANRGIALLNGSGIRAEIEAISSVERNIQVAAGTVVAVVPNPIVDAGTIELSLAERAHVRLTLMNGLGEEVRLLSYGTIEAGGHRIPLETDGLAGGVYFVRLQWDEHTEVHPVSIVR